MRGKPATLPAGKASTSTQNYRAAKDPAEYHLDYSTSQLPVSDKWLYVGLEYPERFPS